MNGSVMNLLSNFFPLKNLFLVLLSDLDFFNCYSFISLLLMRMPFN